MNLVPDAPIIYNYYDSILYQLLWKCIGNGSYYLDIIRRDQTRHAFPIQISASLSSNNIFKKNTEIANRLNGDVWHYQRSRGKKLRHVLLQWDSLNFLGYICIVPRWRQWAATAINTQEHKLYFGQKANMVNSFK